MRFGLYNLRAVRRQIPGNRLVLLGLAAGLCAGGCTTAHYRKSADQQVYKIIAEKQQRALGKTNEFHIETPYSSRKPSEIKAAEILENRAETGELRLTLPEALALAVTNSRAYQFRREGLFFAGLTLTKDRHDFVPRLFASSTASALREGAGGPDASLSSKVAVEQVFKSGGKIGISIANDLVAYFTGSPSKTAVTLISANLSQPLLRGAWADIAAENLTQSERNVVYEVRSYSRFQTTFAIDIVGTFLRILQLKETVRNEFNTYQSLGLSRERAEARAKLDLPEFQVDQAKQDELNAKNRYILAVQNYQNQLDLFKNTLGLPMGLSLRLDDAALEELRSAGLLPAGYEEEMAYGTAVARRLDLLNEIDRFEDAQRKVKVTANGLKADLTLFANATLASNGSVDYARFNWNDLRASTGLQLNLPLDRLAERNIYRNAIINFERQIRVLGQTLDDLRTAVRQGLRNLQQTSQSYEIQRNAVELANRRVESANLLLQAGRAQVRDLLEAQNAQLQARNAMTQALVEHFIARMRFLNDIGVLATDQDRFWLMASNGVEAAPTAAPANEVVPPEALFGK